MTDNNPTFFPLATSVPAPSRAQQAPSCLEAIHRLETGLGIKVVSAEVEILFALFDCSPIPVSELKRSCSVSSAKFFAMLGQLEQRGVIAKVIDPADRRRRLYRLPQENRSFILDVFEKCVAKARTAEPADEVQLLAMFREARCAMEQRLGITFTSARYTILSSLYELNEWNPLKGHRQTEISQVTFFAALDHLKSIGAVECLDDPGDGRKKRCRLSEPARRSMAEAIRHAIDVMLGHVRMKSGAFLATPLAFLPL